MLFATWWLFILILTAFYTANLTAFLTLSLAKLPINDISDVAKSSNKWFSSDGGAIYYAVKVGFKHILRRSEFLSQLSKECLKSALN